MSEISKLLCVQDNNSPSFINMSPNKNNLYNIDLNTRKIDNINSVVVESDHKSRVLYFKAPRYFDGVDLTQMICIIEYINAKKENFTYIVPFYDIETFAKDNEMCFYWEISQLAAKSAGQITFAMTFYRIDAKEEKILYKLNTLPKHFFIIKGIGFQIEDKKYEEQFQQSFDEEFVDGKKYFEKNIEVIFNENGEPKVDQTGSEIKRINFIEATTKEDGKIYYEKINLYSNSIDNYFEVLNNSIKQSQLGDLNWIVLS